MANPSLQIGNSNWAIKEDNLLGYSTAGTRFVPQPITMTRESAGTRVNSSGLVETVELLGSEEIEDGGFPTPNTEWSSFGLATINENIVNFVDAGSNTYSGITQDINSFSAKQYRVEITVTNWISGDILATFSSNNASFNITGNGTYSVYLTPVSNGNDIGLVRDYSSGADFSYSITNVSVKESTKNNLARVDYDGTASSLLVEPQRRNLVTYSEVISNLSLLTGGAGTYTITDNYTDSPEGVQNASRVQMSIVDTNDGANYSLIALNSSMTNGVTREISFYAKSLTGLNQEVLVYWSTAKQIVTLTNDWQRFEISATSDNSGAVLIGTRGGATQYYAGGDANLDFALWGLQVEDDGSGGGSSYATSYIPTDGSTVTRVQDQYSKTGISNLINSEEGVLFVEMAALSNDLTNRSITISDGSTNNIIQILFSSVSNTIRFIIRVGGVGGDNLDKSTTTYTVTDFNKVALKWKQNDAQVWINGTQLGSPDINSDVPTGLNDLSFEYLTVGNNFYGKVKQLQVFKTADIDLAALTS